MKAKPVIEMSTKLFIKHWRIVGYQAVINAKHKYKNYMFWLKKWAMK